jgi:hypothetical protein
LRAEFEIYIVKFNANLPDLPFTNYGNAKLKAFGTRSAAKSGPLMYPRTDLKTLTHWASFPTEIHQAIQSATTRTNLPTTFTVEASTKTRFVANEEKLRAHSMGALHDPVEEVLNMLEVEGGFDFSGSGNAVIVGDPDFSWVTSASQPYPKVIVRVSVTTCVLVKPRWCRLSTKLGGWRI